MHAIIDAVENKYNYETDYLNEKNLNKVLKEILGAYDSYLSNCSDLDDINNWDITRIYDKDKYRNKYRKPKITVSLYITSAGNLVMEWMPTKDDNGETDFLFNEMWLRLTPSFQEPHNRLFRINEFRYFGKDYSNNKKVESKRRENQSLEILNAASELVNTVIGSLKNKFDVTEKQIIHNEHYYVDGEQKTKGTLLSPAHVESIEYQKYAKSWTETNIINDLGLSVDELFELFNDNDGSYAKTTRAYNSKYGKDISSSKLRGRINKLLEFID